MNTEQVYRDTYSIEELASELKRNVKLVEFYISTGIIKFEWIVSGGIKSAYGAKSYQKIAASSK